MPPANEVTVTTPPSDKKTPLKFLLILAVLGLVFIGAVKFLSRDKTMMTEEEDIESSMESDIESLGYDPEQTVEVVLTEDGFEPNSVTISAGQSITWVNNSGQTATVDSTPHPVHTDFPFLNLGEFEDGETKTLVFPDTGTYKYHNHLDSTQSGTVVVE